MIITKSREERGPSRIVFAHTSSTEYMLGVMAMLRVRRQVSSRVRARRPCARIKARVRALFA